MAKITVICRNEDCTMFNQPQEVEKSEMVCPECGEPVHTEYSRIVGFFVPVKTYSKERKAEYNLREWLTIDEEGNI